LDLLAPLALAIGSPKTGPIRRSGSRILCSSAPA